MRFVLPLVALAALSSAPVIADTFNITLTGDLSGSGTFTTDGTCGGCSPGAGLLSLTVNIGPDSGTDAFDISDDVFALGIPTFFRAANELNYDAINSETDDRLRILTGVEIWDLTLSGDGVVASGTFSITPVGVSEPPSLFLLMPIVAIVGLRWRHQRHRV